MKLDLWVKAQKQDAAWEIVEPLVLTPAGLQTQLQRLEQLFVGAAERGIPQSADYLDAGV